MMAWLCFKHITPSNLLSLLLIPSLNVSLYAFMFLGTGCTRVSPSESHPFESLRTPILAEKDLPEFKFCPQRKKLNANNLVWTTYFSALEYSHFSYVSQKLSEWGFGTVQDKKFYDQKFLKLRISRLERGIKSKDDLWTTDLEKERLLSGLKDDYRREFGELPAELNPSAVEEEIIERKEDEGSILFLSGYKRDAEGDIEKTSSQALYAEHHGYDMAILAFRGTETDEKLDLAADLDLKHTKMTYFPTDSYVMRGFFNAYNEIHEKLGRVLEARSKNRKINLWVTGHSLGGAVATIFLGHIMQAKREGKYPNVNLVGAYTIGSPRVGDSRFALWMDALSVHQNVPIYRVRNYVDLVTGLPFGLYGTTGYWHIGSLVYYDKAGKSFFGDGWKDIEENSDIKNSTPAAGKLGMAMHELNVYFSNAKRFLEEEKGSSLETCSPEKGERGFLPFLENPQFRTENWKDLKIEEVDSLGP